MSIGRNSVASQRRASSASSSSSFCLHSECNAFISYNSTFRHTWGLLQKNRNNTLRTASKWYVHGHVHVYTCTCTRIYVYMGRAHGPCTRVVYTGRVHGHVHGPSCTRPVHGRVHGPTRPVGRVHGSYTAVYTCTRPCRCHVQGRKRPSHGRLHGPCIRVCIRAVWTARTRPRNGSVHVYTCTPAMCTVTLPCTRHVHDRKRPSARPVLVDTDRVHGRYTAVYMFVYKDCVRGRVHCSSCTRHVHGRVDGPFTAVNTYIRVRVHIYTSTRTCSCRRPCT